MCIVDWQIVLEFVKALGTPAAAVFGIWLASHLAVKGFRKQKTIERRLDWYERIHRDIARLKHAHVRSALPADSVDEATRKEVVTQVHDALYQLVATAGEASLYAHQKAFQTVWNLRLSLQSLDEEWEHRPQTTQKIESAVCLLQNASDVLAEEIRAEMGLLPVHSASITRARTGDPRES